ncbi:MAG: 16S rRNA (cytosine(1402)-N(4))-methyltransferase RsmH [Desulfobacca sp.]
MHVPVMVAEVLEALQVAPDRTYVDATVGLGGHAEVILQASAPTGRLIGLDQDPVNLATARARLQPGGSRVLLFHSNFTQLTEVLERCHLTLVDGILLDLGLSMEQLKVSGRGFSFGGDEPLDMRLNPAAQTQTAADLLNTWPEAELSRIFWELGEERWARRIARRVVQARQQRPFQTTAQLVQTVLQAMPGKPASRRLHPATRVFQALRLAVNQELDCLAAFLPQAIAALAPQGRLVVIAYHSLEDRIVKHTFLQAEKAGKIRRCQKKPLRPTAAEVLRNPSARSAKLRCVVKVADASSAAMKEVV